MALRAKPPEEIQTRAKIFLFGEAGVGKTTATCQFPANYIIDGEKGTNHYADAIKASGSQVFQTCDMEELIDEVRTLRSTRHSFRTLTIDPITPFGVDYLEKAEHRVGTEWGRHYGELNKVMKRLMNLLNALDMNVIMTAHAKNEYGDNMKKLGMTFDGWKNLDYEFDLVLELQRRGSKRVGVVRKTRLKAFPDGQVFDWSYDELKARYGEVLEAESKPIVLATPEQVAEITRLVEKVKLADGAVEKWWKKAQVDRWDDMPGEDLTKCIEHCRKQIKEVS